MSPIATRSVKKIWVAPSTPFQVNFFYPVIKRLENDFEFLITARDHDRIIPTLKAKRLDFIVVGKHGGTRLGGRLESYADTVKQLAPIIEREKPDLLLTERWPEAVRVAFGFDIPAWTVFYDERERHVNKMVFPLSDVVFAPRFYSRSDLRRHGVIDSCKIVWFNGFHACYLKDEYSRNVHHTNAFIEMGIKPPIILVRPEPEFATFFERKRNILENVVANLARSGLARNLVVIPRTESQARAYGTLETMVVNDPLPDNPVPYSDIVIGAAETMLMESFVLGKPTISNIYWPESQPVSELHKYVPHLLDPELAAKKVYQLLDPVEMRQFQEQSHKIVDQMDNPIQKIVDEIRRRFVFPEEKHSLSRRSKMEIQMDVLLAAASRPCRLADLMQSANLSYADAKRAIIHLNARGMMLTNFAQSDGATLYETTHEGLELLSSYGKLREKLAVFA